MNTKFEYKYKKYKQKYIQLGNKQYGGVANMILLDGTSSSGKTSISKFYETIGYTHIPVDNFTKQARNIVQSELLLENEYITGKDKWDKINNKYRELMADEAQKHKKVIFDDIDQTILNFIDRSKLYIIVVYTTLSDLIRNIKARELTDPRGTKGIVQYARKYIKTDNKDNSLDSVNRQEFIMMLKEMKYEFESEQNLIEFANKIFKDMDIEDDDDHYIMLRDTFKYDYIIKTTNKTKEEIFEELKKLTD